ncbi:SDR family NAD(P)-dependent oxidoreductase [Phytoactinopolyspora sp. XMNu-373]|uniref:SDR family NAD(P)-dependent oxidoreductase n=1 Tax=Phytoactinopolyspora mesophila TaxID=2650750 RepID=A0A7K3MBB1_9ACTN|nr:SDR family NAD(P)-dependent oxidoreductase [Phytoactinopolyspora mesophila]
MTGGTSGIGLAFAQLLSRQGHNVILVGRNTDRLHQTAHQLSSSTGQQVDTIQADLADRADVQRVAERLSSQDEPVDLLVNNAGFGVHARLTSEDVTVHDEAFDVMCRAVLVLGGAAARAMLARKRGTIINVSSTAGFMAMGSYSAIKAWVTTYSESLAVELRGTGVQVTALCPGWVKTEFHQRAGINTTSIPSWLWTDSERVAATCLKDAARGKVISIPSKRFRVLMWGIRHLPRSAIHAASGRITSKRRAPQSENGEVR